METNSKNTAPATIGAPARHAERGGRDTAMDLLRILASVLVVLIHTASQNWYMVSPASADWQAMNIWDSIARPSVPLFLMLSGAFLLAPEKRLDLRALWLRRIPRLAGAYLLWSFIYALYSLTGAFTVFTELKFIPLIKSAVAGQYHLWYLPVIILLYALLPVLRAPLNGENGQRACEYMLLLFLFYGVLRATVMLFDFPGRSYALTLAERFSFGNLWTYAGYFIFGYYLYKYPLPRVLKLAVYAFGICAAPLTAAATRAASTLSGAPDERFYTIFSPATLFCAAALFLFFRDVVSKHKFSNAASRFIGFAASCSLGIYLSHVLFLNFTADRAGVTTLSLPAAFSVPALTAAVWLASFAFTALYKLVLRLFSPSAPGAHISAS